MKLQEIFTYLATGELAQVFLGEKNDPELVGDAHQRAMAQSVQLGLTALHSRFTLKEGQVTIKVNPDRTSYPLRSQYSITRIGSTDIKFLMDSRESPFRDDILKIERVSTLDHHDLPFNMRHERLSVYNPVPDTLVFAREIVTGVGEIPDEYKTDLFKVYYRANHAALIPKIGDIDPERVEVELPQSHLQALLYFVASRKTNPVGVMQEFHAGNSWFQKYELECKQLETDGLGLNVDLTHQRFKKNGWV